MLSSGDYAGLVIAYVNGALVKLTDVAAAVKDAIENIRQAAWMNTVPAVILNIQRQPGANINSVVNQIQTRFLPTGHAARFHPHQLYGFDYHHPRFRERRRILLMLTIVLWW